MDLLATNQLGRAMHASLYERAEGGDGLGYNTAIVVGPDGELRARTRKLHIPVTAGYYEDRYFRPGPAGADAFPVLALGEASLGLPTCWDQWFPEVARAYGLAGAEVLVYPTAIGSEPDHPGFDTEPLWWPPAKIVGRHLAPFLAEHLGLAEALPDALRSDAVPVDVELDRVEGRPLWSRV